MSRKIGPIGKAGVVEESTLYVSKGTKDSIIVDRSRSGHELTDQMKGIGNVQTSDCM